MKKAILFILFFLVGTSLSAYDIDISRQNGMGGCVLLTTPTSSDFLNCPVGFLQKKHLIIESGYQRKFELSDLDKIFFATGYRLGNFSLTAGVSQFGRNDYYIEQSMRTAIAYNNNRLAGAIILSGRTLDITATTGKTSLNALSVGLAAGVHCKKYHLAMTIDNINQPTLYDSDEKQNILYHLYGEIEGNGRFSITGRMTLEKYEKPLIALGQHIRLAGKHALFWGISNNPLTYGGGLEVHYHDYGIVYATSYHPVLGFTHNVSLNFNKGL